jgi:amino acid transporter
MCAGPSSKQNAFALLFVGAGGIAAAAYAAFVVLRGVRYGSWLLRVLGAFSFGISVLAGLIGWLWAVEAIDALRYFLSGRT